MIVSERHHIRVRTLTQNIAANPSERVKCRIRYYQQKDKSFECPFNNCNAQLLGDGHGVATHAPIHTSSHSALLRKHAPFILPFVFDTNDFTGEADLSEVLHHINPATARYLATQAQLKKRSENAKRGEVCAPSTDDVCSTDQGESNLRKKSRSPSNMRYRKNRDRKGKTKALGRC